MLFSVMIPVYNSEKYIEECLDSVLNQTVSDYEIIIVDDGSTDKSGLICDEYHIQNPHKIHVIHQNNAGLIMARRVAMKAAKGEYFIFLDSDDILLPYALEKLRTIILEYSCDLVIYGFTRLSTNGDKTNCLLDIDARLYHGAEKNTILHEFITSNRINNIWLKCPRCTSVDIEADYERFRFVTIGEDILQSLPILDLAESIVYINEPLYCYRKNDNSMTRTGVAKQYQSLRSVFKEMELYINKWKVSEEEHDDFLRGYNRMVCGCIATIAGKKKKFDSKLSFRKLVMQINEDELFLNTCHKSLYSNRVNKLISLLIQKKACCTLCCLVRIIYVIQKIRGRA